MYLHNRLIKSHPVLQQQPKPMTSVSLGVESSGPLLTASNAKLAQIKSTGTARLLLTGTSTSTSTSASTKKVIEKAGDEVTTALLLVLSAGLESGLGFLEKVGDTVIVVAVLLALALAIAFAITFALALAIIIGTVGSSTFGCIG